MDFDTEMKRGLTSVVAHSDFVVAVPAALRLLKLPGPGEGFVTASYALKVVNDGLTHATAKPNRILYFSGTWLEKRHPGYEIREVFWINFAAVICQLLSR
jgi:hypothetical protein